LLLEINRFINDHSNWEDKLRLPPYCVRTKREGPFILLKYNQFDSDFSLPLVRECRGIILNESDSYRPVCIPFFKFGNFGESYVPEIDWSTAHVQEKLDGSLIKLWNYQGEWHISSNSEIDARNAHISSTFLPGKDRTDLYTLFMDAWGKTGVQLDTLNQNYTYMFELTSPFNRIVVKYDETVIHHIGTRDNKTFKECNMDIGIPKPREFPLKTLEDCIESAKMLGYDEEGYVAVDRFYNRVKIKSPRYVALNYMSQGVSTWGKVVEIIQRNEQEEFLTYFPEYKDVFTNILNRINDFAMHRDNELKGLDISSFKSRKEMAAAVMTMKCPSCIFNLIDGKSSSAKNWLLSRPADKVLEYIGMAENEETK